MIRFLRGTTAQNDSYTGPSGSLSIDLENDNIRLHDGSTAGGVVIGAVDASGTITSINGTSPIVVGGTTESPTISISQASVSADGSFSAEDKTKLNGISSGAQVNAVTSVQGNTGAVTIPVASATTDGLVSQVAQAFSGVKTFNDGVSIDEGTL